MALYWYCQGTLPCRVVAHIIEVCFVFCVDRVSSEMESRPATSLSGFGDAVFGDLHASRVIKSTIAKHRPVEVHSSELPNASLTRPCRLILTLLAAACFL